MCGWFLSAGAPPLLPRTLARARIHPRFKFKHFEGRGGGGGVGSALKDDGWSFVGMAVVRAATMRGRGTFSREGMRKL